MTKQRQLQLLGAAAMMALPALSFGALASKQAGKTVTSANLSTNATKRAQQLLVDPAPTNDQDQPLTLDFAQLDVDIHFDMPLGVSANDIISSITTSPLPHFLQVDGSPLPQYTSGDPVDPVSDTSSPDIQWDSNGLDVLIKNMIVQYDPNSPPDPGEVDHVQVNVQFNNSLDSSVFNNIGSMYTVTTNEFSKVVGIDLNPQSPTFGDTVTVGAGDIQPASDGSFLGAPEPTMLAPIAMGLLALVTRRRKD